MPPHGARNGPGSSALSGIPGNSANCSASRSAPGRARNTPALRLVSIVRSFLLFRCSLFGGLTRSSRSLGVDPGHLLGCSVAFVLVFELLVGVLAIFPEDENADVLRGGRCGCGLRGS